MSTLAFGRLADRRAFERALRSRPRSRSDRLCLYKVPKAPLNKNLSTVQGQVRHDAVDNLRKTVGLPVSALALGMVIPKRHARRAVTRNAIRRQIRSVVCDVAARLPEGAWIVSLRAPFDVQTGIKPSSGARPRSAAASIALKAAVRAELLALLAPVLLAPGDQAQVQSHPHPQAPT